MADERSEVQKRQSRRWYTSRTIEEAIREVEPAAEWLRTHPPGAKLPPELEPGYTEAEED